MTNGVKNKKVENQTLYTRCPTCSTAFKVTDKLLAMASGKVRCGACLAIFQATDYMLEPTKKMQKAVEPATNDKHQQPQVQDIPQQIAKPETIDVQQDLNIEEPVTDADLLIEPKIDFDHSEFDDSDLENISFEDPEIDGPEFDSLGISEPDINNPEVDSFSFENPDFDPDSEQQDRKPLETNQPRFEHSEIDLTDLDNESFEDLDIDQPELDQPDSQKPIDIDDSLVDEEVVDDILFESESDVKTELDAEDSFVESLDMPDYRFDNFDSEEVEVSEALDDPSIDLDAQIDTQIEQLDSTDIGDAEETGINELDTEEAEFEETEIDELTYDEPDFEGEAGFENESDFLDTADFSDNDPVFDELGTADELSNQLSEQMLDTDSDPDPLDEFENIVEENNNSLKIKLAIASILILIIIAFTSIWTNRQAIAWSENWGNSMKSACQYLPCDLKAKRDVSKIKLLQRQLSPDEEMENVLDVKVLLINEATFAQPYPTIKIAFSNKNGEQVSAKSYTPADYLEAQSLNDLMPSGSEVHIHFKTEVTHPDALGFEFIFE